MTAASLKLTARCQADDGFRPAGMSERIGDESASTHQPNDFAQLSRLAMLGELSCSIAHELNQPLTAILSNAQAAQFLIKRESVDLAELGNILQDIVADNRRAHELIRRVRAMLRKEELPYQSIDLNEVVRDVSKIMHVDLMNRRVRVQIELALDLPYVDGDRVQLQQILLNLLLNACQAMDGVVDGRVVTISTANARNGGVELAISDRGGGIAVADLERIFEPFVTTKSTGMGLGLAVCRTIAAAHGGRLWATNNESRGATLHFWLPAGKATRH